MRIFFLDCNLVFELAAQELLKKNYGAHFYLASETEFGAQTGRILAETAVHAFPALYELFVGRIDSMTSARVCAGLPTGTTARKRFH